MAHITTNLICLILVHVLMQHSSTTSARMDKSEALCHTCIAIVEKLESAIKSVDPKKKIDIGSFRIHPDGTQGGIKKADYARSEVHLHELLEKMCEDHLTGYFDVRSDDGKEYVIPGTVDGVVLNLNLSASKLSDVKEGMKRACSDILDDHEDDLITYFNKNYEEVEQKFCVELTGYCKSSFLVQRSAFLQEVIQDAKEAQEEAEKDKASRQENVSEESGTEAETSDTENSEGNDNEYNAERDEL